MADRVSTYSIGFVGDDGDLTRFLTNIKSQFRSTLADIETATKRIELFGNLETQIEASHAALTKAKNDVDALTVSIEAAKAAGAPTKELEAGLRTATTQLQATTREFNNQVTAITKLQGQLSRAGIDTKNLASEQLRLADAQKQASAAATDQAAKQALGLKTLKDVQPEIQRLNAAYNTLAASGSLSVKELAAAQAQLLTRTAELRAGITGAGNAAKASGPDLIALFRTPLAHALALTGGIAGVVAGLERAVEGAKEFSTRVAEIGTVTNLSKAQLDALGVGAQQLARDLGLDVNEALKGIFDLLRAGVPPDNVLEVLRVSAEAAKAGLTDVGDGVKAARLLLNNFGADAKDLPLLFDKINQGAKNGGVTFKEFAQNGGQLLDVARAAHIGFDDLIATLTVLTKSTGSADTATASLTKIIAGLDTAAAREKLRELGIEGDGLIDTFQKIGEKGLSLAQILDLGIVNKKAAAGIAALTSDAGELTAALDRTGKASGTTADAIAKLFDTPKERGERFSASIQNAANIIGRLVGSESRLASVATSLLNQFNALPEAFNRGTIAGSALDNSVARAIASFFGVVPATGAAAKGIDAVGASADGNRDRLDRLKKTVDEAGADLKAFGDKLIADVTALQAASARDIADATTRADAQIAALDRSAAATVATAKATVEIQTKLSADKLSIIVKEEADVTAAVNTAVAARTIIARKAGDSEAKIAADNAQLRINALAPVLAQYQAHYAALIAQEQAYAAKLQSIGQERLVFNQGIEKTLFDIRLQGLSVFDQYVAKAAEADRLVSLARAAAATGDIANAKRYTDEAIALAGQLKKVTDENGVVVITATQAQQQALGLVKKAADAYNSALDKQDDLAKAGAAATKQGIDEVVPKLQALQKQYDDLKATVAEGLKIKVELEESALSRAFSTIADLVKPETKTITIKTVNEAGGEFNIPATGEFQGPLQSSGATGIFARGGFVAPQPFEAGGPVSSLTPEIIRVEKRRDGGYIGAFRAGGLVGEFEQAPAVRGFASAGPVFKSQSWARYSIPSFATGGPVETPATGLTRPVTARVPMPAYRHYVPPSDALVRPFATGGPVFKRQSWSKVPGIGDGDTVPALLDSGSFVMRKAAVQMYGDSVMGRLARGYAYGGNVNDPNAQQYFPLYIPPSATSGSFRSPSSSSPITPVVVDTRTAYQQFYDKYNQPEAQSGYFGDIKPGTKESSREVGQISAPSLPSDPIQKKRVILKYVADVETAAFSDNYGYWAPVVKLLNDQVNRYQQIPTDDNLDLVLQIARGIGLNLGAGKAQGTAKFEQVGFDVDGRRFRKVGYAAAPAGLAGLGYEYDFYAQGGQVAAPVQSAADVSAPTLPADPAARQQMILDYAQRVATAAQSDGPAYWHDKLTTMATAVNTFQAAPSDVNLTAVIDSARAIGLNLGAPHGTHTGYDIDGRTWHQASTTVSAPGTLDRYATTSNLYAKGGAVPIALSSLSKIAEHWHSAESRSASTSALRESASIAPSAAQQAARLFMTAAAVAAPVALASGGSTDTVPAMLTPGEFVFSVPAVKTITNLFGGGFLDRMNSLQISRESIDQMINLQPPRPHGFQYGGSVGNAPAASSAPSAPPSAGGVGDIHLHFHGFDQTNEWIDRTLIPRLQEKQRRSGGK